MSKTGRLSIDAAGNSTVGGTPLARNVPGRDPFGAATDFMKNHGCDDGDCVMIEGQVSGGNFWLSDAKKVDDSQCQTALMSASLTRAIEVAAPAKPAAKKTVAKKSAKKAVKKSAKKATKVPSKTVSKKAAKKSAKKASRKGPKQ